MIVSLLDDNNGKVLIQINKTGNNKNEHSSDNYSTDDTTDESELQNDDHSKEVSEVWVPFDRPTARSSSRSIFQCFDSDQLIDLFADDDLPIPVSEVFLQDSVSLRRFRVDDMNWRSSQNCSIPGLTTVRSFGRSQDKRIISPNYSERRRIISVAAELLLQKMSRVARQSLVFL